MSASDALVAELRAAAPELNAVAAERILADPFWAARYGVERSRKFAFEDGAFHLQYAAEALAADDAGVMVRYARWLRGVLVPRGMCSEHLAHNFRLLAGAIATRDLPGASAALELLARAEAGLVHEEPSVAQAVARAAGALVEAAAATLPARLDAPVPRAELLFDLRHLVSYLADALALGAPTTLVAHARWADGFMASRGRPPAYLHHALAALEDVAGDVLTVEVAAAACGYLASALAELGS